TELTRTRNRPERPRFLPGLCVVSDNAAANLVLAAGNTGVHEAVVVERSACDRVAGLPRSDTLRPHLPAGLLVKRHKRSVELAHVALAVTKRDPAARPAATNGRQLRIQPSSIDPLGRAGLGVCREHVIGAGDRVDDTAAFERLRFARILLCGAGVQMDVPDPFE